MQRGNITYSFIEQRTKEMMQKAGGSFSPNAQTLESALLQMMSAMGELTTLAHRIPANFSPFENHEVPFVVGKVAVALTLVSLSLQVHAGEAALLALESSDEQKKCGGPSVTDPAQQTPQEPEAAHDGSLYTQQGLFEHLDQALQMTKSMYEKNPMRWIMPTGNGTFLELIRDGGHKFVNYSDLPLFAEVVRKRKDDDPYVNTHGPRSNTVYDGEKEAALLSISHNGTLYAPSAASTALRPPPQSFTGGVKSSTAGGTFGPSSGRDQRPPSYYSTSNFELIVQQLQSGKISGKHIAALGLTFSVPDGKHFVDLVPNGMHVAVDATNVKQFLQHVEQYWRKPKLYGGKVHRTESVRRLDVHRQPADESNFSPSHDDHGLFSPHDTRDCFFVDYDDGKQTLPKSLQCNYRESTPRSHTKLSNYLAAIYRQDYRLVEKMIIDVCYDPSAVEKHGITFAVPSALAPDATAEERKNGLHALCPDSAYRSVESKEHSAFLTLAAQYFPSIRTYLGRE